MKLRLILLLACSGMTMSLATFTNAGDQLDLFEVAKVSPSRLIKHDVSIRGRFDAERVVTDLKGPEYYSQVVAVKPRKVQNIDACLNWYRITNSKTETTQTLRIRDLLHEGDSYQIDIGSGQFLLSPAQRLTSGPPTAAEGQRNHFKAYGITEAPPISRPVQLKDSLGPEVRTVLRAAFLCVPVQQWHHHEHSPVERPEGCFVVYELEPSKHSAKISTIDQFGLNELSVESCVWLCIPAEIISDS